MALNNQKINLETRNQKTFQAQIYPFRRGEGKKTLR
jgi:hypothetical protein